MLEQQYMEQCYQKLLEAGYPEDRIIKDYRLLEGLRTDFAILPPGLNSLPMIIIEVKHNLNTGNKWLKTVQAKKIQKDFDLHCYVYSAEDNLFIDIESSEDIRQLTYFLYTMCERKGNAEDARYYNELMTSWHAIVAASMEHMKSKPEQMRLF